MKTIVIASLLLMSSVAWTKCVDTSDAQLDDGQRIVKNILKSAYELQIEGRESHNLSKFTDTFKINFSSVSEHLDNAEIAALLIEEDLENNICPNGRFIGPEALADAISDKIIDTYYGCGCKD